MVTHVSIDESTIKGGVKYILCKNLKLTTQQNLCYLKYFADCSSVGLAKNKKFLWGFRGKLCIYVWSLESVQICIQSVNRLYIYVYLILQFFYNWTTFI